MFTTRSTAIRIAIGVLGLQMVLADPKDTIKKAKELVDTIISLKEPDPQQKRKELSKELRKCLEGLFSNKNITAVCEEMSLLPSSSSVIEGIKQEIISNTNGRPTAARIRKVQDQASGSVQRYINYEVHEVRGEPRSDQFHKLLDKALTDSWDATFNWRKSSKSLKDEEKKHLIGMATSLLTRLDTKRGDHRHRSCNVLYTKLKLGLKGFLRRAEIKGWYPGNPSAKLQETASYLD